MVKCIICKAGKGHIVCRICGDGKKRCKACNQRHVNKMHKRERKPDWTSQDQAP